MTIAELLVHDTELDHFIEVMDQRLPSIDAVEEKITALHESFYVLLSKDFIPREYKKDIPGIFAQYLLYRNAERSLSLMAMVVPPKISTPIHNHLAWGLVGIYQGTQREIVYETIGEANLEHNQAELKSTAENILQIGDITTLKPPHNDIHMIETISDEPSISLHLLGNDIGCQARHAFDQESNSVRQFTSGYVNADCN